MVFNYKPTIDKSTEMKLSTLKEEIWDVFKQCCFCRLKVIAHYSQFLNQQKQNNSGLRGDYYNSDGGAGGVRDCQYGSSGGERKSLGARPGNVSSKFVPPVRREERERYYSNFNDKKEALLKV